MKRITALYFFLAIASASPAFCGTWNEDILPASVRDRIFQTSGLDAVVADWDELDRDVLWVHALNYTADQLIEMYPTIAPKHLRELSRSVKEASKQ